MGKHFTGRVFILNDFIYIYNKKSMFCLYFLLLFLKENVEAPKKCVYLNFVI